MSLVFTNDQVKSITKEMLDLPLVIDNPSAGTGLIQQKANIQVTKDALLTTDTQNKVFSDHWISIAQAYHNELERLNKDLRTTYADSDLVLGGQSKAPHYTGSWPNLVPILIPSNKGDPVNVSGTLSELERITNLTNAITPLISGFTGTGSVDSTLSGAYTAGSGMIATLAVLTPGDKIIIDSGGSSMLALVGAGGGFCTGETPPGSGTNQTLCTTNGGTWTPTVSITPLSTDKNFGIGARIRNFHAGFSNSERGHQSTNYASDVQAYFEAQIVSNVAGWKTNLQDQLNALNANGDTGARKVQNDSAKSNINAVLPDITTWEGSTVISPTGKFTDSKLPPLIVTHKNARNSFVPTRATEIGTGLGTPSQTGDGTVTGNGVYKELWNFVVLRIAKSGGTLYSWYNMDLGIKHFDVKIANAQNQLAQYANTFALSKMTQNSTIGQNEFTVESATDFSISDSVFIMDNASVVYTRTITGKVSNTVTLNSGIPVALTTGNQARISKQK